MKITIYSGSVLFAKKVSNGTATNHFCIMHIANSLDEVLSMFKSNPKNLSLLEEYDTCFLNIIKVDLIEDNFFNEERHNITLKDKRHEISFSI